MIKKLVDSLAKIAHAQVVVAPGQPSIYEQTTTQIGTDVGLTGCVGSRQTRKH